MNELTCEEADLSLCDMCEERPGIITCPSCGTLICEACVCILEDNTQSCPACAGLIET